MKSELKRHKNGVVSGVCLGLSEYFDIDVVIIRLLFILLFIFGYGSILIYLILFIALPLKND